MKKALILFIAFSMGAFAKYDTLDFSKNTAQFKLINNSNNIVTVDTIKIFRVTTHLVVNMIVFDTVKQPSEYWNWQHAPFQYGITSGISTVFPAKKALKINKKDTLIIREASELALCARALTKRTIVIDSMRMVFIRSDEKNDTIIARLRWDETGSVKVYMQLKEKKCKIPIECLMNGKKVNIPPSSTQITTRKNQFMR